MRPAEGESVSITRPTAGIVGVALALAWLLLTVVDVRDNDGAASNAAVFGIPALTSAAVIQLAVVRIGPRQRLDRKFLWWVLCVLPLGILAGVGVAILREPDYFFGDATPWMLIWMPIFVGAGLLLGAPVWFFFVFPVAMLIEAIRLIARGEAKIGSMIMPLVLLALGVLAVIGGISIDTHGVVAQFARGVILQAILGLPGDYDIVWMPGLWVVRGIIVAIVLVFLVPKLAQRRSRPDHR